MDRVEDRTRLSTRPYPIAVDAQIAETQEQTAAVLGAVLGVVLGAAFCQFLERERSFAGQEVDQRGILLAVLYRVQAERRGLGGRINVDRMQPQPPFSRGVGGIDRDSARRLLIALGHGRIGAAAHLSQAHEV
jgi:hypothetical protein